MVAMLCNPIDCGPPGSCPGKNSGVGIYSLLQGIFPPRDQTQVSCIVGRFFSPSPEPSRNVHSPHLVSQRNWLRGLQFSSVLSLSRVQLFENLWTAAARPHCPSPIPGACSNSCPESWWCHPAILSSVIPFSSCLQSFPASGSFPMNQFFASGGQSTGASVSASRLNIQDRFPLGWTGLISLQSKGLSRVFSNTTVQKHQFCDAQLSS